MTEPACLYCNEPHENDEAAEECARALEKGLRTAAEREALEKTRAKARVFARTGKSTRGTK